MLNRPVARIALIVVVVLLVAGVSVYVGREFVRSTPVSSVLDVPAAAPGAGGEPGAATQGAGPSGPPSATSSAPRACSSTTPHVPGGPDGTGGCWPGPDNTGVPKGTRLTPYTGPCTITSSTPAAQRVIDSKLVTCDLRLNAANVVIRKSKVVGTIYNDENLAFSFTLEDSEVDAGKAEQAAVWHTNLKVVRSNVHGGQTSVSCWKNCEVRDSWLHGQEINPGRGAHLNGFLSNGGSGVNVVHNTIVCDNPGDGADGGCSGDINLFGDFEPIEDTTIAGNLLGASTGISYCIYGGDGPSKPYHSKNVVFRDNIVQRGSNGKCGSYGPVTGFDPNRPGNTWTNNRWADGGQIASEY